MNAAGYAKTLRQLGRIVPSRTARIAAAAITGELQKQFDEGRGPYGDGWAALKSGGASHLDDSGTMRGQTRAIPASGSGLNFESPTPANYHQRGTYTEDGAVRMSARKILPDLGVPASWGPILQEAFTSALRESLP